MKHAIALLMRWMCTWDRRFVSRYKNIYTTYVQLQSFCGSYQWMAWK